MKEILKNIPECSASEYIGNAHYDTIGLVISNVDDALLSHMGIGDKYKTIGIIGSRTGAGAQVQAVDDAVKATNCKVLSVEIPRDTKGGGGHGVFILIGSNDVSDAKEAVNMSLELIDKNAGELYISSSGHLEVQFTANAGDAVNMAFGAPKGQAFGFICACPAPVGLLMADTAVKSAGVNIVDYRKPSKGTSHSNEIVLLISGEASAVKQAVINAREVGLSLLGTFGADIEVVAPSYLQ